MRKAAGVTFAILAGLWPAAAPGISAPRLVADLATVPSPQAGSAPAEFVRIGSHVLFTAQPDDHAREQQLGARNLLGH